MDELQHLGTTIVYLNGHGQVPLGHSEFALCHIYHLIEA